MVRCQAYALRRDEISVGIMRLGQIEMHGGHHFFECMRAGYSQYTGMRLPDHIAFGTQTAGNNHLAVFMDGFTIASSDSSTALSINPQVLTTIRSASS